MQSALNLYPGFWFTTYLTSASSDVCFEGSRCRWEKLKERVDHMTALRVKKHSGCGRKTCSASCCWKEKILKHLWFYYLHDMMNNKVKPPLIICMSASGTRNHKLCWWYHTEWNRCCYIKLSQLTAGRRECLCDRRSRQEAPRRVYCHNLTWTQPRALLKLWNEHWIFLYISTWRTPACAIFPFHKCDRLHPCQASVLYLPISRWGQTVTLTFSAIKPPINIVSNDGVATTTEQLSTDWYQHFFFFSDCLFVSVYTTSRPGVCQAARETPRGKLSHLF